MAQRAFERSQRRTRTQPVAQRERIGVSEIISAIGVTMVLVAIISGRSPGVRSVRPVRAVPLGIPPAAKSDHDATAEPPVPPTSPAATTPRISHLPVILIS